jgi:site-specific recombinase XerD
LLVQQHDLARQIESITVNLRPYVRHIAIKMAEVNPENGQILYDYITAELTEKNISDNTRDWKIKTLTWLSSAHKHGKSYNKMTKADILLHLNALRKPIDIDPEKKWIGTYNNRVLVLTNFFRWLYNPDESDYKKRKTPSCMNGVKQLPRKTKTCYKPEDMWTAEDDHVFLKYCPVKRDRCYQAMARETDARPHELLNPNLKIRDLQVKIEPSTGMKYAAIVVSGKTGVRTLPLIDSLQYAIEWLEEHRSKNNPDAPLFVSLSDKSQAQRLRPEALLKQFNDRYKAQYFPRLLNDPSVSPEDKEKIRRMLKKPWNPYVFRHSGLTEKAKILTEANLRNHAGWTMTSKMPSVYIHLLSAESSKSLLEAKGIINKDAKESNILQSKTCPQCHEPNTPHAKFCQKCKMVLSYDGYAETQSKFQDLVDELGKAQMDATATSDC